MFLIFFKFCCFSQLPHTSEILSCCFPVSCLLLFTFSQPQEFSLIKSLQFFTFCLFHFSFSWFSILCFFGRVVLLLCFPMLLSINSIVPRIFTVLSNIFFCCSMIFVLPHFVSLFSLVVFVCCVLSIGFCISVYFY